MIWDRKLGWALFITSLLMLLVSTQQRVDWFWQDLFLSRDQQGHGLFERGQYHLAALRFENPEWRATAYYAAEAFQQAAAIWADIPGAQAHFKRANALAHLKDYAGAADGYRLALQLKPDWLAAQENLALMLALAETPEAIADYGAEKASKVGADEIVFSNDKQRMAQAKEEVSVQGGLSSQEINALWMRRLQSTPADFLRLKFRYQIEVPNDSASPDTSASALGVAK